MTLCELMHKVEWADLKPYIERHLPERPETKLADYERLFERLRDTAPARWIFPVTFRFFPNPDKIYPEDWGDITHDTVDYRDFYVADHAFGASLPACLASNVEKYRLSFRDAEWAAYCVWELMRINGSRDKGDEQPVYIGGFRNRRQSWFHRIELRLNAWGCTRRVKRLAKRLQCEQESAQPDDRAMRRLRRRVCSIEAAILKITGTDMDRLITKHVSEKEMERVGNLICQRQGLLNRMFTGTPEEVERMEQVNDRLLELSRQMYSRSAALYRKVLTDTRDEAFDDDVVIEGSLKYNCDAETSVLPMSNDWYYGSDFCRMLQVIDWLYMHKAEGFELEAIEETGCKSWEPKDIPGQSDAELGFEDSLNDGTTWAEGVLRHPAFEHICLCHAVHDICTHKYYSIPDLLRMNDFWCEVKVTHQHIVDQSGSRWKWWEHCSFEEFRDKLRTEAAHRPEQLRLGQYIMVRTSHLFPDTMHPSLWGGADDCFNDDDRVDAYLRRLYDTLQKQIES